MSSLLSKMSSALSQEPNTGAINTAEPFTAYNEVSNMKMLPAAANSFVILWVDVFWGVFALQAHTCSTCLNKRQEQGQGGTWPGSSALFLVRLIIFQEAFRGIC